MTDITVGSQVRLDVPGANRMTITKIIDKDSVECEWRITNDGLERGVFSHYELYPYFRKGDKVKKVSDPDAPVMIIEDFFDKEGGIECSLLSSDGSFREIFYPDDLVIHFSKGDKVTKIGFPKPIMTVEDISMYSMVACEWHANGDFKQKTFSADEIQHHIPSSGWL